MRDERIEAVQKWIKGEKKPGQAKKNPTGSMDVCVVCCKDGSMERKVT
jgi:hypothetical protein